MDTEKQALLTTLTDWSKLSNANGNELTTEVKFTPEADRLHNIVTANRGKAQPLPSTILLPV